MKHLPETIQAAALRDEYAPSERQKFDFANAMLQRKSCASNSSSVKFNLNKQALVFKSEPIDLAALLFSQVTKAKQIA